MQQKLWLKDFEHHISAQTWNAADILLQSGAVKNLREVEKHLWVALVATEEGQYETEMIISPHKIKAFTCECFGEGRLLILCACCGLFALFAPVSRSARRRAPG